MSLLTVKQIDEICNRFLINKDTNIVAIKMDVEKWNEQQTPSTQFEPDWNNAPSNAKSVFLHAVWFDNEMNQVERTVICGWGRPKTPHPHAEMIAKYAEVAQRRVDPWVEFEWFDEYDGKWKKHDRDIKFNSLNKFRHIGETK